MSGQWAGSTRRAQLPPDWPQIRARILQRDSYICRLQLPGCQIDATDADHIRRGNDHSDGNLQAACSPCHAKKSSAEGNAAHPRPTMRRPPEPHPGLL